MRDLSPFGARWSVWAVILLAAAFALGLLFNNVTPIGQRPVEQDPQSTPASQ